METIFKTLMVSGIMGVAFIIIGIILIVYNKDEKYEDVEWLSNYINVGILLLVFTAIGYLASFI